MNSRYAGFDPHRNKGVRRATFFLSLLVHGALFAFLAYYRMPGGEQVVLTPFNVVELAEPAGSPRPRSRAAPRTEPAPPPARREPVPPPRTESRPIPRAAPAKAPPKGAPKTTALKPSPVSPEPAPILEPVEPPSTVPRRVEDTPPLAPKPKMAEKPKPPPREYSEEDLRERMRSIRERVGAKEPQESSSKKRPSDVAASIERIRQRVGEPAPSAKPQPAPNGRKAAPLPSGEAGLIDTGESRGTVADMRFAAYRARLWSHVKARWSLPPSLAGRGLSTVIVAMVTRNGVISEPRVEISSGVEAFDLAAMRALLSSSPLPELPADIPDEAIRDGLGFRFTESGSQ